jgi:hypothetical protein
MPVFWLFWKYAEFAAAIASLLRLSIQVGMPSTGNPVSTDFPLSSILISTI